MGQKMGYRFADSCFKTAAIASLCTFAFDLGFFSFAISIGGTLVSGIKTFHRYKQEDLLKKKEYDVFIYLFC